ncbi:exopolysaccharide biosynthesis protein [Devosia sediminis]|uniref:Exopolysaccharide biosynthesis protein n=1 Tax=Devosia sediminis TaxID=2798801 RepID=A0A934MN31_9HYPH|nr:exopolysaccharide biosynthesis protein [Devosia sediminis]MBJ3786346.1 exopolysaccharide biosynthesis protein [Devosia sediminis]
MSDDAIKAHADPVIPIVDGIVAKLRAHAAGPDAALTCDDLLAMVGHQSHVLAIMIFALLNLLPGPPGYNSLMGVAMFVISIAMLRRRPMRFAQWFGRLRLPIWVIRKLLDVLATIIGWAARLSAPRWRALVGAHAMPAIAVIGVVLGLVNISPIPFMNIVPSTGLAIICLGVLNQDGAAVVLGSALGALGATLSILAIWVILALLLSVGDMV